MSVACKAKEQQTLLTATAILGTAFSFLFFLTIAFRLSSDSYKLKLVSSLMGGFSACVRYTDDTGRCGMRQYSWFC